MLPKIRCLILAILIVNLSSGVALSQDRDPAPSSPPNWVDQQISIFLTSDEVIKGKLLTIGQDSIQVDRHGIKFILERKYIWRILDEQNRPALTDWTLKLHNPPSTELPNTMTHRDLIFIRGMLNYSRLKIINENKKPDGSYYFEKIDQRFDQMDYEERLTKCRRYGCAQTMLAEAKDLASSWELEEFIRLKERELRLKAAPLIAEAKALKKQNKLEEALLKIQSATEEAPYYTEPFELRSAWLDDAGRNEAALSDYNWLLAQSNLFHNIRYLDNRVKILVKLARYQEALADINDAILHSKFLASREKDRETRTWKAAEQSGDPPEGRTPFDEELAQQLAWRAQIYGKLNNPMAREADIKMALGLLPPDSSIRGVLAIELCQDLSAKATNSTYGDEAVLLERLLGDFWDPEAKLACEDKKAALCAKAIEKKIKAYYCRDSELFSADDSEGIMPEKKVGSNTGCPGTLKEIEVLLKQEDVEKMQDPSLVLTQIRAVPYFRDGGSVGIRVFAIKQESIFAKMGLQDGDILIGDCESQSTFANLMNFIKMLGNLMNGKSVKIKLERNLHETVYKYKVS